MPQSLSAQEPSLLDEGSGVASATSLLSNIENSLMFIHEQKVQKVQKLQKQKELQKKCQRSLIIALQKKLTWKSLANN
jgi:hypothetical protein